MPLIKVDLIKGKNKEELKQILDALHEAVVAAFHVPERDRYQILTQHEPHEMILLDTGMGFTRDASEQMVVTVISKKRTTEEKQRLYKLVAENLKSTCRIASKNILVAITENADPDWSFGFGNAQFLTGEL